MAEMDDSQKMGVGVEVPLEVRRFFLGLSKGQDPTQGGPRIASSRDIQCYLEMVEWSTGDAKFYGLRLLCDCN